MNTEVKLSKVKMAVNNGVPELSDGEFKDFISKGCVLIDFYAEWCMPCVMMAPIIEDLASRLKSKIKVGKVNVDDNTKIAQKFKVLSIPTYILFMNGEIVDQIIGGISEEALEKRIGKHC